MCFGHDQPGTVTTDVDGREPRYKIGCQISLLLSHLSPSGCLGSFSQVLDFFSAQATNLDLIAAAVRVGAHSVVDRGS